MKFVIILLLSWLTLVSSRVLKPSQDEFYDPPANLQNVPYGTILKSRITPGKLRSLYMPMNVNSWQILVKSKDNHNEPIAIMNTIIQPNNFDPEKVVVFQYAQDCCNFDCAPSYSIRYGADMSTLYNQVETIPLQLVLDKGYTVVATDYQGPTSNFPGSKQSGYSTLDTIRAITKSYNITGISDKSKFILWGYSGGSVPVSWAAALIDEYPDIKHQVLGAIVGGMLTNLTSAAVNNEGSIHAGLVATTIAGLMKQNPKFNEIIQSEITNEQYEELLYAQNHCLIPIIYHFMWHKFFTGLGKKQWSKSGYGIFANEILTKMINENTVALNEELPVPKIPIFLYHGQNDEVLPWSDTKLVYDNWCDWGAESVEFFSDQLSGHITGLLTSSPAVVKWMMNRFSGIEPVKGCHRIDKYTFLSYPGSGPEILNYLTSVGKCLLGIRVGPSDDYFLKQFSSAVKFWTTSLGIPGLSFKVLTNMFADLNS